MPKDIQIFPLYMKNSSVIIFSERHVVAILKEQIENYLNETVCVSF